MKGTPGGVKNKNLDTNVAQCRREKIMEIRPNSRSQMMKAFIATLGRLSLCKNEWKLKLFRQWKVTTMCTHF